MVTQPNHRSKVVTGAFTVTELLVSILIISVIVVVLLPVAARSKKRANEIRCLSNLRGLGLAVFAYATDNRLELPPGNTDGSEWFKLNSTSWLRIYGRLGDQPVTSSLLRCPSDPTRPPITDYQYYYSYTWNSHLLQAYIGGVPAYNRAPVKLQEATNKLLFADAITHGEDPATTAKYPAALTSTNAENRISPRHFSAANALFGDGSVRHSPKATLVDPALLIRN